jgi:hypothetical protein
MLKIGRKEIKKRVEGDEIDSLFLWVRVTTRPDQTDALCQHVAVTSLPQTCHLAERLLVCCQQHRNKCG